MTTPLIECVPNFSEGRDQAVIRQITAAVESVEGVTLLDVDPGRATNRTVVTFVGPPQPVIEAAVRAGRKAKELIDMRKHKGEHPRFGAMDVCPLVPVAHITMDEVVPLAHELGRRLGEEVGVSGYFYEYAATRPERRNLAACRAAEYEGLPARLKDPNWKTDFGPGAFDASYGVTAVGARDFLVAYNVNLNTTSTRRANAVAFDIREKGRIKTVDGTPGGKPALDEHGQPVWEPGSLKAVKAIGWYIAEYGIAQISINLTNLGVTPVHVAFDECCRRAEARGMRVTGSELVGLMPLGALLDAGRYFLRKQRRSLGVSDKELIKIAVKSLGLGVLYPFRPEEKVIEYAIAARAAGRHGLQAARSSDATQAPGSGTSPASLTRTPLDDFVWETASESPAPGGGSVSAAIGAMGAALATMVANLSAHKQGWDDRWEEFSRWAEEGKRCHDALLRLVDEDTAAFNALMASFGLPKGTDAEKAARSEAIQSATKGAIEAPLRVMEVALESMQVARQMAEIGLPASVSDAGVAALAARSAVMGAHLNVKINARSVKDKAWIDDVLRRAAEMERRAQGFEREILALVEPKLGL
ncbi:MAG TPA: glutamate formimidoyltransferase [Phycisphaerae bacterium]|nr:glutamate formimidoyltransferase [Phycisphaerae bacterium]